MEPTAECGDRLANRAEKSFFLKKTNLIQRISAHSPVTLTAIKLCTAWRRTFSTASSLNPYSLAEKEGCSPAFGMRVHDICFYKAIKLTMKKPGQYNIHLTPSRAVVSNLSLSRCSWTSAPASMASCQD